MRKRGLFCHPVSVCLSVTEEAWSVQLCPYQILSGQLYSFEGYKGGPEISKLGRDPRHADLGSFYGPHAGVVRPPSSDGFGPERPGTPFRLSFSRPERRSG